MTVAGTLYQGVEAGCVILRANDGMEYLLLGWSNYPPAGTRVRVTGYAENNVATYCMQGKVAIRVVSISIFELTTSRSGIASTISYGTVTASSATVISGSTQQSTTTKGVPITISGYVYAVVENPECYPPCGAPSLVLTFLYIPPGTGCTGSMGCYPPPQYYWLRNIDGSPFWTDAPNGTYANSVTGMLVMPSSWNCESFYVPKICILGDIFVQRIIYSTIVSPTLIPAAYNAMRPHVPDSPDMISELIALAGPGSVLTLFGACWLRKRREPVSSQNKETSRGT